MRRRLDIAASIVVTPDLLFLDEPTTGLDPRSRNQVWDIVRALVAGGTTVLLTHAVPRRGRPARRPDRHHRPRPGDRRGHQRRAEGAGRIGRRSGCASPSRSERAEAAAAARRSVVEAPVLLESDPTALSAHAADTDEVDPRHERAVTRRDRRRRVLLRPAQPRRGVPGPHRPSGRGHHHHREDAA